MEYTNEETVTMLLSKQEILKAKQKTHYETNPMFNLGEFLKNVKPEPSRFGSKYVFVK